MLTTADSEIVPLLELSARLGRTPSLVQAGTGNTSVKIDGVLWIKASGKWLAQAGCEQILVPVDLAETRARVDRDCDPAGQLGLSAESLRTSVETAMHAVLWHRVVLHVHSVNTIAFAVRRDGMQLLSARLAGLRWKWIPYVASGLPLAHEIERVMASAPDTDVLVLANHGLVVCGESCGAAEALLQEVESRVALVPRAAPEPDYPALTRFAGASVWRLPVDSCIHALGTDAWSAEVLSGGVLYPCQAIFLSPQMRVVHAASAGRTSDPFLIVAGAGVLVSESLTVPACATLSGLAQILQRIDPRSPVRYLADSEVANVMSADTYRYRELVEINSRQPVFAS